MPREAWQQFPVTRIYMWDMCPEMCSPEGPGQHFPRHVAPFVKLSLHLKESALDPIREQAFESFSECLMFPAGH